MVYVEKDEIGRDVIYNIEDVNRYKELLEKAKKDLEKEGSICFFVRKEARFRISPHVRIAFRMTVIGKKPGTDFPEYKYDFIDFRHGRCRLSDPYKVAYLDLLSDDYIREKDLPPSPLQIKDQEIAKLREEISRLREKSKVKDES